MSNFSTVADAIRSTLLSTFSSKTQIPNPYAIERNSDVFLEDGWGILFRTGAKSSEIEEYCRDIESRTVDVLFVRRVFRVEIDTDNFHSESKSLIEDTLTFKKIMLSNNQLGIDSNLEKIDLQSDSGINFVFANEYSFIYTIISFNVQYSY